MKILVLNGPNLNLLGVREEDIYGNESLQDVEHKLKKIADEVSAEITFYQSNAEHKLIDAIHDAYELGIELIIFNPAAYTHTSIALRDALLAVKIPFYEIHISNIENREEFRQKSYFSDIAVKVFSGHGTNGYLLALKEALKIS
tara:strand:- start:2333 stop:2764 length:432 start_codon:yes stop_codon:yes gene_type:complete